MMINYKDKFYIFHPDGKFTEEQLIKALDAAYNMGKKDGYNDGYEAGKRNNMTITYPWWNQPYYRTTITCDSNSNDFNIIPTSTGAIKTTPCVTTATTNTNREFKYNGTER